MRDASTHPRTPSRAAARALDLDKLNLTGAIEQMADGVVITDAAGSIQYVNPAFTKMTGYAAGEVIDQNPRILKSGSQNPGYYKDLWESIGKGGVWRGDLVNRRKDGSTYAEEMTITPLLDVDGAITGYVAVKHDVTRRRAAEAAQRLLASIVESTDDAVICRNRDGRIITWNRAAEKLLGYGIEEVQGRPISMLLAPESLEKLRCVMEGVNRGESFRQYELTALTKSGERRNVSVSTTSIRDAAGAVTAAASIIRDITERKDGEEHTERMLGRQRSLSRLQQSLLVPAPLENKLQDVADAVIGLLDADFCRVWLIRPGDLCERGCPHAAVRDGPHLCRFRDQCLHLLASSGHYTDIDGSGHRRVPFGCYKIGRLASNEDPKFVTNDAGNDPGVHDHAWARGLGLTSFAGYQIRPPGGETLGVLALFARHPILAEDDATLEVLGSTVALVVKRAAAEEALRQSEERFRQIVTEAGEGISFADAEERFQFANPAAEAIFGVPPDGLLGRSLTEFLGPEELGRAPEEETKGHGGLESSHEIEILRPDGTRRQILLTEAPSVTAEGQFKGTLGVIHDITERRRANQAFRESEARFRTAFQNAPVGMCISTPDWGILQANEAFCGLLGYSEREVIERGWWGISCPDERAIAEAGRQSLERDKCPSVDFEKRYVHKQGHAIWFQVRVSALRDGSGKSAQFITHAEDITGRKRAVETLRRSEEKYRQLVNNIPDIVWTADARGARVWVSRNCEAMCGHTPDELCQPRGWYSQIHPDDLRAVEEAYGALVARGEPYSIEYRLRRKDGLFLWVHDRAVSTYQRDGQRFTDGCLADVTERRLYSELVEQLQRRNELILNSAGEGILGLDSDGKFTFINPAAALMLSLSSRDAIGESAHELVPHTHAGGGACSAGDCAVTATLRDGAEHRGLDMVLCPPGRESFRVEFVSTPKLDEGRLVGAVVVLRDITEAQRARGRIEASLKEKEALLREIHHRVKNNLQIVCSLLKLNSRGLTDPEARQVIEDTQRRVKAMALVHETLYRSGDLAGIDFSEYIPRLAEQLLHAYGLTSRQVSLTLDVESTVLPIDLAIPCALMLTELISNAAKHVFTVERGGALGIMFRRVDRSWQLQVRNPAASRAPDPQPGRGASFGLELVRLLTEQLDGSVRFEHAPDFCVSITFPLPTESRTP